MRRILATPVEQQLLGEMSASSDGRLLAVGVGMTAAAVWDLAKGQVINVFLFSQRCAINYRLAMSPNGQLLAVVDVSGDEQGNRSIRVFDVVTGELKYTLKGFYVHAAFSPDNTLLAVAGADGAVGIWRLGDNTAAIPVKESPDMVTEVAFSPDGTKLAWICSDHGAGHDPYEYVESVIPYFGGDNSHLTVWDILTGTKNTREAGKEYHFDNLAFSPNGQWVMATRTKLFPMVEKDAGNMVCCWDVASGKPSAPLQLPAGEMIRFARFTQDNAQIIGVSHGSLACWDFPTGQLRQVVNNNDEDIRYMFRAGKDLVTYGDSCTISLRHTTSLLTGTPATAFATLYNFDKDTWLAVSSQGYFDGSPSADKAFCWQYQGEFYPYEKFAEQYHRPELLREAMANPGAKN